MPKKEFHLAQICKLRFFCLGVFLREGVVDCVEVAEGIPRGNYGDRGSNHFYNHWLWTIGAVIVSDVH